MRKIYKSAFALFTLCSIFNSMPILSYAEITKANEPALENQSQATLNGYDESTWAKLMDNKLEYEEIDDLVKNFNPDIKEAWNKYDKNINNLKASANELLVARRNMSALLDEAKKDSNIELSILYTAQIKGLDASTKALKKAEKNLEKPVSKTNAALRQATKQVSLGAKTLMINYKNLENQENLLNELVNLNENMLKVANLQQSLGLASSTNIDKANADLLSAKSNLANIKMAKEKLRISLIQMLGWSAYANPEIEDIQDFDLSYIDKMNLEEDLKLANSNDSDLVSFRNGRKNTSSYANEIAEIKESDMENTIKIEMTSLYNTIKEDKLAYEATKLSFDAASLEFSAANKSKELGLLSESAYLGAKVSYLQKKAEFEASRLELISKIEDYKSKLE